MEMYQEPQPVENPLEDPDSPMEDMPPLEPEPVTHYEPDIPRGQTYTLSLEVSGTHYFMGSKTRRWHGVEGD